MGLGTDGFGCDWLGTSNSEGLLNPVSSVSDVASSGPCSRILPPSITGLVYNESGALVATVSGEWCRVDEVVTVGRQ